MCGITEEKEKMTDGMTDGMTVGELIAALQLMPKDAIIWLAGTCGICFEPEGNNESVADVLLRDDKVYLRSPNRRDWEYYDYK